MTMGRSRKVEENETQGEVQETEEYFFITWSPGRLDF